MECVNNIYLSYAQHWRLALGQLHLGLYMVYTYPSEFYMCRQLLWTQWTPEKMH